MNTSKVTFAALATMAVALSVAMLVSSVATPISAALTCETKSGNAPAGQQDRDKCNGEGLTFKNPAGKIPGGWDD
jgi:hypothetical protein